jgi:MFS family permease
MYVFAYMDRYLLALMVDPIKGSLGITDVQFSLIQGLAFGVFYGLFGLPMGWLVDRYSPRWVLFGGICIWSLSTVFCGLASNFVTLAIARFGVGAGEAALIPAGYSMILRILPRGRVAVGLAIFSTGASLGTAIAHAVGGYVVHALTKTGGIVVPVMGHLEPWQAVFVLIGSPGLIVGLLAFTLPSRGHLNPVVSESPAAEKENIWQFMRGNSGYLLLMIGGMVAVTITAVGVGAWAPALLMRRFGQDVAWVGIAMSVISLTGMTGFLGAGFISDSLFRRGYKDAHLLPIVYGLPLVVVLAIGGFALSDKVLLTVGCTLVIVTLCTMANAVAAHVQLVTPPGLRGQMAAIKVAAQQMCGLTLGPLFVALLTDHVFHDTHRVGESMAIMVAAMGSIAFILFALGRRQARAMVDRRQAWAEGSEPAAAEISRR